MKCIKLFIYLMCVFMLCYGVFLRMMLRACTRVTPCECSVPSWMQVLRACTRRNWICCYLTIAAAVAAGWQRYCLETLLGSVSFFINNTMQSWYHQICTSFAKNCHAFLVLAGAVTGYWHSLTMCGHLRSLSYQRLFFLNILPIVHNSPWGPHSVLLIKRLYQ